MKWKTCWDEIEIMAETEKDINILKQLKESLSEEPLFSYDIGEFEAIDKTASIKPFFFNNIL